MAANGNKYDWESITVTLPGGEAVAITEIKYEDGQGVTARYGRGSIPRGYGRGNYEASGSMVLDREEWEKLKKELTADGGGIYDHTPFTIVVSYANDDMETITNLLAQLMWQLAEWQINKIFTILVFPRLSWYFVTSS